ncbi:hypothetical protein [Novosphingobium percolationis]|uniref:hypothetical protein n=1 Tax=Novosphingobium percolationis TaxID=2871811 RepID=UPI001CD1986D|nr:hypothetical protein [Novosphingobium percolationis]
MSLRNVLLIASALSIAGGCTAKRPAAAAPPVAQVADTERFLAENPFPTPEGDLVYVRRYASYTAEQERLALLAQFAYRLERTRFAGYQMVWQDQRGPAVNVRPPFDKAALLANASPEIRSSIAVHPVRFDKAELEEARTRLTGLLAGLPGQMVMDYAPSTDRFRITLDDPRAYELVEQRLPPDLAGMIDVSVVKGPLLVF